jgi:hypothetical protein
MWGSIGPSEVLLPMGIRWGSQCTISIALNPETLELAARSGCSAWSFFVENKPLRVARKSSCMLLYAQKAGVGLEGSPWS